MKFKIEPIKGEKKGNKGFLKESKKKLNKKVGISIPLIRKDPVKVTKNEKRQKLRKKRKYVRGVVYFSHIPHGFYEDQIKDYCSQFGHVTNVYLPKSKRGGYRGYGFVEFKHPEVAQIVAETMNNYLMFNRLIKAKYLPPSEQRPNVMRRSKFLDNKIRADKQREKTLTSMTRTLNPKEEVVHRKRMQKNIQKQHAKLEKLNLDYDFQVVEVPLNENKVQIEKT